MGNVLYRLRTNTEASRLNLRLGLPGDAVSSIRLEQYEFLAKQNDTTSPPTGITCYLLKEPADTSNLATNATLFRTGRKKPDPKKIPDFWTTGPLPTVTEAFRELIEEIDPGIHQFFPINLVIDKTTECVDHARFYRFICGRLLEVPEHSQTSDRSLDDAGAVNDYELRRWRTIQERPDIQAYLERMPIWRFHDASGREACYLNKEFLDAAHQRSLSGFKESSDRIHRDVQHVRY